MLAELLLLVLLSALELEVSKISGSELIRQPSNGKLYFRYNR